MTWYLSHTDPTGDLYILSLLMFPWFHVVLYAIKLKIVIPHFFEKSLHSNKIFVLLIVFFFYFGKLGQFGLYPDTLCGSTHICLMLYDSTHPFPLLEILLRETAHKCVLLEKCFLLSFNSLKARFSSKIIRIEFCLVLFINKHFNDKGTFKTRGPMLKFHFLERKKIEL